MIDATRRTKRSYFGPATFFLPLGAALLACSSPSSPPGPTTPADQRAAAERQPGPEAPEQIVCGPQSPRDITVVGGTNTVAVPQGETPNLCNVHFHEPFEHAGLRWTGNAPEPSGEKVCESVDYGDEVEFHWVYTNCDLPDPPRPGLENCVCDRADMVLRVYARAYVVSDEGGEPEQPSGGLVRYPGSTTGVSYGDQVCSPARVAWAVDPEVEALRRASLATWCETNPWEGEDRPHGSRPPVTREDWLSPLEP